MNLYLKKKKGNPKRRRIKIQTATQKKKYAKRGGWRKKETCER